MKTMVKPGSILTEYNINKITIKNKNKNSLLNINAIKTHRDKRNSRECKDYNLCGSYILFPVD